MNDNLVGFNRAIKRFPDVIIHGAMLVLAAAVVLAAGQPIFTDDLWWHLAMGRAYAASGPWLDSDPFLIAAQGPAEPAAWLADVVLHVVHRWGGFQLLRAFHAMLVFATLALAWSILRRASDSGIFASVGVGLFSALSAYRMFQLRPDLFTMFAALLLVRLLVSDGGVPGRGRIIASTVVMVFWANLHGAFVLGPVLIGAALAGELASLAIARWRSRMRSWQRARSLGLACALGLLAACLNPAGPRFLLLYFMAGAETPSLGIVSDEWAPVRLFALPLSNIPPSPLSWGLVWALIALTPLAVGVQFFAARSSRDSAMRARAPDPAAVAVAIVSLVGMLSAVRLLWLAIFPLMIVGQAIRAFAVTSPPDRWRGLVRMASAGGGIVLLGLFFRSGDWPMISQAIQPSTYGQPFSALKYHAHGVWLMDDAGLRGRIFNDYWIGNFLGYWLAPQLKVFVNGSLNVPPELMQANFDIRAGTTDAAGRSPSDLLDLYGIDVFFGTGLPIAPPPGRPLIDTTRHLESNPGWVLVFRDIQTAIYVRDSEAGRRNLERLAEFYGESGVPFDPVSGFDPEAVIQEAPDWALRHGLIPTDFMLLRQAARNGYSRDRLAAEDRLASIYALLGVYGRAIAIDERLAVAADAPIVSARRLVWALLHAGRIEEASVAAERLAILADAADETSQRIVVAARRIHERPDADRTPILAALPLFTRPQGRLIASGFVSPAPRPGRE